MSSAKKLLSGGVLAGLGYLVYKLFNDKSSDKDINKVNDIEPSLEKVNDLSKNENELHLQNINLNDIEEYSQASSSGSNSDPLVSKEESNEVVNEVVNEVINEENENIGEQVVEELNKLSVENKILGKDVNIPDNENNENNENTTNLIEDNIHRIVQI